MREWDEFLSKLARELGPQVVEKWMPKLVRFDAANIYLEADSFQINWFEEHIRPRLKGFVNDNQRPIKVHFLAEKKAPKGPLEPSFSFSPDATFPEMTLEQFVPSEKNLIATQILTEGAPPFNPIYLYGSKGAGKTHLLMGAALALQKKGKRVCFIRAETFTEHVVQAIRLGRMREFRNVYRDIDALIIDDIHIFSKKAATQEEFFHTFNALHTQGRPILISANAPPSQLREIEPRLISRFEWGITLELERSDLRLVLEKKALLWKMTLSYEMMNWLIEKFPNDPVLPLQALNFRSKGAFLNPMIGERLLKDLLEKEEAQSLTSGKIIKCVSAHYGITVDDLLGKSQIKGIVFPRRMAMFLCRKKLKLPFQKIGEIFDRDHSTVMSSIKQIQKEVDEKKIDLSQIAI